MQNNCYTLSPGSGLLVLICLRKTKLFPWFNINIHPKSSIPHTACVIWFPILLSWRLLNTESYDVCIYYSDVIMGTIASQNHQPHDCLLNRLFRRRLKKTSKLRVTGLCAGNSPGTGEFPAQMASNAENMFPFDDVIMLVIWKMTTDPAMPRSRQAKE